MKFVWIDVIVMLVLEMTSKVESGHKLHTRMRLWEFPDEYVVEPTDGTGGSFLSVSRVDGSMKLLDELPHCSAVRVPKIQTIYGVIGVLKLLRGSYLFVINERQCVGSYLEHPIFKVASMKILPCDHSLKTSPADHKRMETEFSTLLNCAQGTTGLFFSYDVNLSLSMQRLRDLGDESKTLPLWRQADPRYLWNNYMMEGLIDNKLDPYLLPILQGSFHHFQAAIGKDIVDVTLIARRCTRRTGTRMWRRGADPDGYVANFVETEQMMQLNGYTASFVQVRGSMPFLWEQIVDLKYKPKFEIVKPEEAPRVAERHFLDLRKRYGSVLAVDLVNKHGGEGHLCEMYGNSMQNIVNEDIRYLHFDFHKICGHIHFERLSMLFDQMSDFLNKSRYLLLNEKGEKIEVQQGVVRTNCIDCLDRTNVTQSMIGRKMLESQLRRIGVFAAEECISGHPNFDANFKILWANHGDDVSIQYSGTPALKGDFVRYGQRTIEGILKDGWNALARYYLNNFRDGTRQFSVNFYVAFAALDSDTSGFLLQILPIYMFSAYGLYQIINLALCYSVSNFTFLNHDAIDLVHGNFIVSVSRDMTPQPQKGGLETVASLPIALVLVLAGFLFSLTSLRQVPSPFLFTTSTGHPRPIPPPDGLPPSHAPTSYDHPFYLPLSRSPPPSCLDSYLHSPQPPAPTNGNDHPRAVLSCFDQTPENPYVTHTSPDLPTPSSPTFVLADNPSPHRNPMPTAWPTTPPSPAPISPCYDHHGPI
ncbi:hypothetical protein KSS87_003750 [Heliosperma pusillum]|nr:hypothetical protein KSS87_003750 [Heliosperma pusillum]